MESVHRPGRRSGLLALAATALLSVLVAGCSSSGKTGTTSSSSKPAYCAAADELKASVQNLGKVSIAANGLDTLKTALGNVQSSVKTLADEAKSEFAPEITAVQGALSGLDTAIKSASGQPSAATIAAIGASVAQVKNSVGNLATAVSGKCK
jgi:gas vesicle protein